MTKKQLNAFKEGATDALLEGYKSDLRFNDPKNVIVGLYAKGRALKDQTGFVQDV